MQIYMYIYICIHAHTHICIYLSKRQFNRGHCPNSPW
uniref:Uncharacterized protein n=1 Tax=Anguilla anguilla TaxID=7936 RepID=A0A0E9TJS0_ANGAN